MGMNYYLHKKVAYDPPNDSKLDYFNFGCTDSYKNNVITLTNGYVWNNTFYKNLESLNKDYCQIIHIGKSSCGWHFSLCVYPTLYINNIEDWIELFKYNEIYNEEGELISASEMLKTITDRKAFGWDSKNITEYEKSEVESHNRMSALFPSSTLSNHSYTSYDEILRENHAKRGYNGLWRHSDPEWINHTGCTYDYINGETHIFS